MTHAKHVTYTGKAIQESYETWQQIEKHITSQFKYIIVFRGAGSNNGIDPKDLRKIVSKIVEQIETLLSEGPVCFLFDGDGHNEKKPDIGTIFGRLRSYFEENQDVLFVAAQKESWYTYAPGAEEGAALTNADGLPYVTFVFEDDTYEGDHNSFTQSEALVSHDGYQMWFVGPSGNIANQQLADYDTKAALSGETRPAVFFRSGINREFKPENDLLDHAAVVDEAKEYDTETFKKAAERFNRLLAIVEQRENYPYGVHFTPEGAFALNAEDYKDLHFTVIN